MNRPTASFLTTQWTQVLAARGDSTLAGEALRGLCGAYYEPVNAFLRRSGRGEDEARDLAHGFFEWLLSRDPFAAADRQQGRFRSYLLGALKHFLNHEHRKRSALKRGGHAAHVALEESTGMVVDPPDRQTLPPDREFDRQWALHVLRRALETLDRESMQSGEHDRFCLLKPFLTGDATHGGLAALAAARGWPEATARSHLHRLRRRFREAVKQAIAPTLSGVSEAPDEMAVLMAALTGSGD